MTARRRQGLMRHQRRDFDSNGVNIGYVLAGEGEPAMGTSPLWKTVRLVYA